MSAAFESTSMGLNLVGCMHAERAIFRLGAVSEGVACHPRKPSDAMDGVSPWHAAPADWATAECHDESREDAGENGACQCTSERAAAQPCCGTRQCF